MVSNTTLKIKKMKYVIALLFALTFSKIDAQNLQFSQVLTLTGQVNGSNQTALVGTVPEGKVWKIESLNNLGSSKYFEVNGIGITTPNSSWPTQFPIWLKSQDNLSCRSNSNVQEYFVSIIEFTIVP
jgi:hypothetical protein